jgi:hypothetical protein
MDDQQKVIQVRPTRQPFWERLILSFHSPLARSCNPLGSCVRTSSHCFHVHIFSLPVTPLSRQMSGTQDHKAAKPQEHGRWGPELQPGYLTTRESAGPRYVQRKPGVERAPAVWGPDPFGLHNPTEATTRGPGLCVTDPLGLGKPAEAATQDVAAVSAQLAALAVTDQQPKASVGASAGAAAAATEAKPSLRLPPPPPLDIPKYDDDSDPDDCADPLDWPRTQAFWANATKYVPDGMMLQRSGCCKCGKCYQLVPLKAMRRGLSHAPRGRRGSGRRGGSRAGSGRKPSFEVDTRVKTGTLVKAFPIELGGVASHCLPPGKRSEKEHHHVAVLVSPVQLARVFPPGHAFAKAALEAAPRHNGRIRMVGFSAGKHHHYVGFCAYLLPSSEEETIFMTTGMAQGAVMRGHIDITEGIVYLEADFATRAPTLYDELVFVPRLRDFTCSSAAIDT